MERGYFSDCKCCIAAPLVRSGSFATLPGGPACHLMSASLRKRPSAALQRNDAKGQKQTHALPQTTSPFDHLAETASVVMGGTPCEPAHGLAMSKRSGKSGPTAM
jgi:hypothetical protein